MVIQEKCKVWGWPKILAVKQREIKRDVVKTVGIGEAADRVLLRRSGAF